MGEIDIISAPLLLSGPEVALRLGIGISHFHALIRVGKFPLTPLRLGRSVKYRADHLGAWIEAECPAVEKWRAIISQRAEKSNRYSVLD
jgi:predicted DNA-binding transcriptional regulator AlpA